MRVSHVITRLIVGGAQENTLATVFGLRDKPGVEVDLISGPSPGREGSLEMDSRLTPGLLVTLPELVRPIHPWLDWIAVRKLTRRFRQHRPDIVHTHSGKAGLLGRAAAHRAGVRCVIHTIHGPSFGPFQGALANICFRAAERWAGARTTHFISVADAMTRQYLAAGIGNPDQYTRIPSGFPLDPFLRVRDDPGLRKRLGLAPEHLVVGMIGRLFKLKGHDDLLSVAPALLEARPNMRFLIVGDGPWRDRLESTASAGDLSGRFVFTGLIPPPDIPRYVGLMDILVHLSRREGLPRALPQALAAGRPVVAYDCDGAGEVCLDGQTGFLIPPGDAAGLVRRLLELASDPGLRRRLGEQGREQVRKTFPVERMVDDIFGLYRRLVPEGAPRA